MVEKSGVTRLSNHLLLYHRRMGLVPFMLVLVDHQLLMLVVGQSININKLLVEEKSNSQGDIINQ
jgi:rRNA-processing protein FCF1